MTAEDWSESYARAVTMALSGDTGAGASPDNPFLLMLNAWWEPLDFHVPDSLLELDWRIELDTAEPGTAGTDVDSSGAVNVTGRSLVLLRGGSPVPA
jgi:glycogen operon protein